MICVSREVRLIHSDARGVKGIVRMNAVCFRIAWRSERRSGGRAGGKSGAQKIVGMDLVAAGGLPIENESTVL